MYIYMTEYHEISAFPVPIRPAKISSNHLNNYYGNSSPNGALHCVFPFSYLLFFPYISSLQGAYFPFLSNQDHFPHTVYSFIYNTVLFGEHNILFLYYKIILKISRSYYLFFVKGQDRNGIFDFCRYFIYCHYKIQQKHAIITEMYCQ